MGLKIHAVLPSAPYHSGQKTRNFMLPSPQTLPTTDYFWNHWGQFNQFSSCKVIVIAAVLGAASEKQRRGSNRLAADRTITPFAAALSGMSCCATNSSVPAFNFTPALALIGVMIEWTARFCLIVFPVTSSTKMALVVHSVGWIRQSIAAQSTHHVLLPSSPHQTNQCRRQNKIW